MSLKQSYSDQTIIEVLESLTPNVRQAFLDNIRVVRQSRALRTGDHFLA